jgi:hypothetical protein
MWFLAALAGCSPGTPVRAEVTYGQGLPIADALFERVHSVEVQLLLPVQPESLLAELEAALAGSHPGEIITPDVFLETSQPITIPGTGEWSPVLGSPVHMLRERDFERVLELIEQLQQSSGRIRAEQDLLVRARLQFDLAQASRSLGFWRTHPYLPLRNLAPKYQPRSLVLEEKLEDLISALAFSPDELAGLPDTGALGLEATVLSGAEVGSRELRWADTLTQHEQALHSLIDNVTLVVFPAERDAEFGTEALREYALRRASPAAPCAFLLLDRIRVLGDDGRWHTTAVTTVARSLVYEQTESRPHGDTVPRFAVTLLDRTATSFDWAQHVQPEIEDAWAMAFTNLPNVPGIGNLGYATPLQVSCLHCHGTDTKVLSDVWSSNSDVRDSASLLVREWKDR